MVAWLTPTSIEQYDDERYIDGQAPEQIAPQPDYGSVIRTHQGNLSGTHFGRFGVSGAI